MILQRLYKDAGAIMGEQMPPSMYDTKPIKFVIDLDRRGRVRSITNTSGEEKGLKSGRPRMVPIAGPRAGFVLRPALLADTGDYVLGIPSADGRHLLKHARFREIVAECAEQTKDDAVRIVAQFLQAWNSEKPTGLVAEMLPLMANMDRVSFTVAGDWPVDHPIVQEYWGMAARERTGETVQCLVTGLPTIPDKSLTIKVRGLRGSDATGVALISANKPAFESYGWERGLNSPIDPVVAERIIKSINYMIWEQDFHLNIGAITYLMWTPNGSRRDILDLLDNADFEQVESLRKTLFRKVTSADQVEGEFQREQDSEEFFCFGLAAKKGRAEIRDAFHTTSGLMLQALERWFDAQMVVSWEGKIDRYFGCYALARSLHWDSRKPRKMPNSIIDQMTRTVSDLMRAILRQEPLPLSLLSRIQTRNLAEQRLSHERAALGKAVRITNVPGYFSMSDEERKELSNKMAALDMKSTNPAYLCGRLLAQLAEAQYLAVGKVNANIIDRAYAGALQTPKVTLGIMHSKAQRAWLPKLRRQRPAVEYRLKLAIEDIIDTLPLDKWPAMLPQSGSVSQFDMSLGCSHQRSFNKAERDAAIARKKAGEASEEEAAFATQAEAAESEAENGE